jgi:IS4 transposase
MLWLFNLSIAVRATVSANQVWMADRNFCTADFLCGIAERQSYFVIRAHQNLPWQALAPLNEVGDSATGTVSEQPVQLATQQGHDLILRRVVVRLNQPTRHGDWEVVVFTNLPAAVADALTLADLYRSRWSVEGMFQVITDVFSCELNTLGYPKAALFVFTILEFIIAVADC